MVRVRCVVTVLLMLAALPVAAAKKATKSTRPPASLHKVGDHWTAYNPPDPASFSAGSNVYTIVKGDTLWALAQKNYNNAYLWPQLWEANTYITDAHWIYPGDPLLLQGEAQTGTMTTTTGIGTTPSMGMGGESTASMSAPTGAPIPLGAEADIFCFGYLGAADEQFASRVSAFEDVEVKFTPHAKVQDTGVSEGDVVFLEGGTNDGLIPGDTYIIIRPEKLVLHPETKVVVGRHYDYRGQMRILCATETSATALITQSCKDVEIGDVVKPLPLLPIPLARQSAMADACSTATGKANGFIVHAQDYSETLGEGNVIQINLGRDDFVEPGDFLTVFRDNPGTGTPRQILGEVGVLTAEGHTATAKVTRMRYAMRVGDHVELK